MIGTARTHIWSLWVTTEAGETPLPRPSLVCAQCTAEEHEHHRHHIEPQINDHLADRREQPLEQRPLGRRRGGMLDVFRQDPQQFAHRRTAAGQLDIAARLLASGDEAAYQPGARHVHLRDRVQIDLDGPAAVHGNQPAIVLQQCAEAVVAPGAGQPDAMPFARQFVDINRGALWVYGLQGSDNFHALRHAGSAKSSCRRKSLKRAV